MTGKSKFFIDCFNVARAIGEIWFDSSNNECAFRANGSIACRTINNDLSLTVQSERDRCDLNVIKNIYDRTGIMNNVRTDIPRYGDFTSFADYHSVVFRAQQAEDDFMSLPAALRARFSNDPGKLIEFVSNPSNAAEAVNLGLLVNPGVSPQVIQEPQGESPTPSKDGV